MSKSEAIAFGWSKTEIKMGAKAAGVTPEKYYELLLAADLHRNGVKRMPQVERDTFLKGATLYGADVKWPVKFYNLDGWR